MKQNKNAEGCFVLVVMFLILIIQGVLIVSLEFGILGVLGLSLVMIFIATLLLIILAEINANS